MSNREIKLYDINAAMALHAEEIAPGEWRWTEPGMSCLARGSWRSVIEWTASKLATLSEGQLEVSSCYKDYISVWFKESKAVWYDNEFLLPNQYLPKMIPQEAAPQ